MSFSKLASAPVYRSLSAANSLTVGRAAWCTHSSCLRSTQYTRAFTSANSRREQQAQNQSSSSSASSPAPSSVTSKSGSSSSDTNASDTSARTSQTGTSATSHSRPGAHAAHSALPPGWEDDTDYNINSFKDLPHRFFGHNQHIKINEEFKETLRQILWDFKAPIRYAFAYGSGVFGQKSSGSGGSKSLSPHPHPPKSVLDWQKGGGKVIDFVFGVSHTQHWHSINLNQHPEHYSGLKYLPYNSGLVSKMQDNWGAGLYYHPYIIVNGIMIKYGVVNLDTLARDLSEWDTLYLAGRLQKPVKILRDDPRIRLANQVNLISALRTSLLMLPEKFTEKQLYERIAGLSYLGDPRMNSMLASEASNKVSNIVGAQLPGFRQLYVPLIENLPNIDFNDARTPHEHAWEKEDAIRHTGTNFELDHVLGGEDGLTLQQDMDPVKRGNMVRRLPKTFRRKLYYQYKQKFAIPGSAFSDILQEFVVDDDPTSFSKREGGEFERRIAEDPELPKEMAECVRSTVAWPSTMQSIKGVFTSGVGRSWKYLQEKRSKGRQKKAAEPEKAKEVVEKSAAKSTSENAEK